MMLLLQRQTFQNQFLIQFIKLIIHAIADHQVVEEVVHQVVGDHDIQPQQDDDGVEVDEVDEVYEVGKKTK